MRRLLPLFLCFLIIMTALAACGGDKENGSQASSEAAGGSRAESTEDPGNETSEPDHLSNPDIYKGSKYAGNTLTFYTVGVGTDPASEFVYNEDTTEEMIPAAVNDAIKARNNQVSEALGVEIKEIYYKSVSRYGGDSLNKIRSYINTADDETFQVLSACIRDCGLLALENSLYDLYSLDNINMKNPWWEQSFNDSVTIAGQLYFTIGDIGTIHKNATPCVYYNADLFERLQLDDPVRVAEKGEWTIDAALTYSKNLCVDSSPPEGMDYLDEFGWAGQNDDMYAMLYGAGVRILSPDAEGYPALTLNTPTAIGTMDKILGLMLDDSYIRANNYFHVSATPADLLRTAFEEGRCLFFSAGVKSASDFDMADTFGILPVPKFTAEQDEYYSLINTWVTNAYCIAANCSQESAEFAAAVMDVMGYYSWAEYPGSLSYNYYEKMLKSQKLSREDSEAMLDLIFAARGCDLGSIFQLGQISGKTPINTILSGLLTTGAGTFTSTYEKHSDVFQNDVDTIVNYFKSNE